MTATIAKTSRTTNTEREPTMAEWVAELVKVVKRMAELVAEDEAS